MVIEIAVQLLTNYDPTCFELTRNFLEGSFLRYNQIITIYIHIQALRGQMET